MAGAGAHAGGAMHPRCSYCRTSARALRLAAGARYGARRSSALGLLVVPGGPGVDDHLLDQGLLAQRRRLATDAQYVTSVCTGSLLLGAAGLLAGRRATSHWTSRDLLAAFGAMPDSGQVVRDGRLITGGGGTAGIDFALQLAAEIAGENVARLIQTSLEYAPEPPFTAGTPASDPEGAHRLRAMDRERRGALELKVLLAAERLGKI